VKELVNSTTDKVVESSQEKSGSKNERVEEINLQKSSKEEKTESVRTVHVDVTDAKELIVLKGVIRPSVIKGEAPLDVYFDVEGEGVVSYSWDFGDDSDSDKGESVFHTFEEPGKYKVELIILDGNGNSITLMKDIEVENSVKRSLVFVPDVFSPNEDGHNDIFKIVIAEKINIFNATIKTLKGEDVYQWNNIEEGWDGKNASGRMMEPGLYLLTVYAKDANGIEYSKAQVISLRK